MALPVCRIQSVSFTRCIVAIIMDTRYMDGDEIVQKKRADALVCVFMLLGFRLFEVGNVQKSNLHK